ncbi:MAG: hypothetical protein HRT88_09285 [Lentisphaeraceae bacterium]|nr:hypothetical protein [Lentisphaeraceae bacterium]
MSTINGIAYLAKPRTKQSRNLNNTCLTLSPFIGVLCTTDDILLLLLIVIPFLVVCWNHHTLKV